jgi:carbamoyltransferase
LAGGVALNCVANGKIIKEKIFKNVWIQPAAGDAGGSIGAALAFWHLELKKDRKAKDNQDSMKGSYLGTKYSNEEANKELDRIGAVYEKYNYEEMIDIVAKEISKGKSAGWFQGKMEFGPRALGARSIIADPRDENMQKNLNLKIKFRESFRPFAPAILEEKVQEWFDFKLTSPYMLVVANILDEKKIKFSDKSYEGLEKLKEKRSVIPAVTHVDYSARIQTVDKNTNYKFYDLIKKFEQITNCPILVNTSFNVRDEPIVNTVEDAFKCFMATDLDLLVIENSILKKEEQFK